MSIRERSARNNGSGRQPPSPWTRKGTGDVMLLDLAERNRDSTRYRVHLEALL
jgi:hypothetical protein